MSELPRGLSEPSFDPNALRVLNERYFARKDDGSVETPREFLWRVASAIAQSERPYAQTAGRDAEAVVDGVAHAFYEMLSRRDFMPNTPCLVNAGRPLSMLSACFVLSVPDSMEGIFDAVRAMALIQKAGGGTGFAFSDLRESGARVYSTGKDASGPVSFMKVFNAATDSIKQGGVRRGANMAVLRVDHPDVFNFMHCKKELDAENRALYNRMSDTGRYSEAQLTHIKQELLQTQMNNFNVSIGVTDAFMDAVERDADFNLVDPKTKDVVRTVKAREIWDGIVEGAWQNGEPGVLFLDHPEWNPLPGLGPIQATNPCVTADTLVAVADGRGHVSIGELAAEGKDVPVYCYDDRGSVAVRVLRRPRVTGRNSAVYKITLDDGSTLRATANHKFRLRDGSYREVNALQAGDSLALLTKFEAPVVDVLHNAGGHSKQNSWWLTPGGGRVRAEHRLIAEHFSNARIPGGHVVHHRDRNAQNNYPDNLEVMSKADHDRHHAQEMSGDRNPMRRAHSTWSSEKWAELEEALAQGYDAEISCGVLFVNKECEVCGNDFTVPYVNREIAHCSLACNAVRLNSDAEIHVRRHASPAKTLNAMKDALRTKQLDVFTELRASGGTILKSEWVAACKQRGVSAEISRANSPFRSYADLQEAASYFNHRVVTVEADGFADVYNGTVDDYHNFFTGGFEAKTKAGRRKLQYVNNRNCGEQALHGGDSCNLGSINVGHFYDDSAKDVDWDRLAQAVGLGIRFLDNVIDANIYPLDEIRQMVTNNRRVGLGIMGFADLLIQLRVAYGSPEAIDFAAKLMHFIRVKAEDATEILARERGDFPNKHLSVYADDPRPRRNVALLSIAPTGTISMIAGCSFGCEPYFGMAYTKHVMKDSEGRPQNLYYVIPLFEEIAKDEGFFSDELLAAIEANRGSVKGLAQVPKLWQEVFTVAADVSVDQHIDMLAAFQKYTCNAVSKTINAPNDDTRENVAKAIFRAYKSGCKGFTYYRDGSRTEQVVTFSKDADIEGANRDKGAAKPAPTAAVTAAAAIVKDASASDPLESLLARANALLGK
jgi:ribonucleoside-diphosphate reductase alpha chain